MHQVGGDKRISTTAPFLPSSVGEIEGSRLHHWLPKPSRGPVFHRAGFKASSLCVMSSLVAGPGLEGGQVAILRLHMASSCHVTSAAYSCEGGWRITQLQYLLQLSLRTSENPQKKLSEKSRRCVKRGLPGHRSGTVRPVSAPLYRPNPRSERCSHPFSDSFKAKFAE